MDKASLILRKNYTTSHNIFELIYRLYYANFINKDYLDLKAFLKAINFEYLC